MNKHEGTTFESFLKEEGILEHCTDVAKLRIQLKETQAKLDIAVKVLTDMENLRSDQVCDGKLCDPESCKYTRCELFVATKALKEISSVSDDKKDGE